MCLLIFYLRICIKGDLVTQVPELFTTSRLNLPTLGPTHTPRYRHPLSGGKPHRQPIGSLSSVRTPSKEGQ